MVLWIMKVWWRYVWRTNIVVVWPTTGARESLRTRLSSLPSFKFWILPHCSLASYPDQYEANSSQTSNTMNKKTYTICITGYVHNVIPWRINLCPFLLSPMHRSCYTIPPTWPPLSPTPHPVCSQLHQVFRLAAHWMFLKWWLQFCHANFPCLL